MPAFIFLIFFGGILLWLLLSFTFVPLGRVAKRVWKDAKDAMNDYEEETEEKTETEETINKDKMNERKD